MSFVLTPELETALAIVSTSDYPAMVEAALENKSAKVFLLEKN